MSANHSDCRYAIRGVQDPVTGSLYTTFSVLIRVWCATQRSKACVMQRYTGEKTCGPTLDGGQVGETAKEHHYEY